MQGLQQVIATVAADHLASQRVLTKAGMCKGALRRNDDGSFSQLFEWWPDRARAGDAAIAPDPACRGRAP